MAEYRKISINVKPEDYEKLELIANNQNLTVAAYCRNILKVENDIDKTYRAKKPKVIPDEVKRFLYLLSSISNNLNQVARRTNSEKVIDQQAILSLFEIENSVKDLTADFNYFLEILNKG